MATVQPDLEREVGDLHSLYAGALMRFASTFMPDEGACRDSVQEGFLRYFVERRYGRCIENPRAWLYQAVRNQMLDRLKSAATWHEVAVQEAEHLPAKQRDPQVLAERKETAREIAAALSRRELECLRLRSEGLSYQEIGETLLISSGTVAALLGRVHVKLRGLGSGGRGWTFAGAQEALRYLVLEALPDSP
jgi:RNA polymerase sigma-70 factor (ECF subfamily)